MKALIVSGDLFEDSELLVPWYRLLEEGIAVEIAAPQKGPITGKHGYQVEATLALAQLAPADFDLLILPGGKAPARLRSEEKLLALVRSFFADNKPVAAICHGPQILVSAGVLAGRKATCYKSVAEELRGAGCAYTDAAVVVDKNLITSRIPADLPFFLREIMRRIHCRGGA